MDNKKQRSTQLYGKLTVVAAIVVGLAACSSQAPEEQPVDTATPVPTETVTVTESAEPEPVETQTQEPEPPPLADIGFNNFREAAIGMGFDDMSAALGTAVTTPDECVESYGTVWQGSGEHAVISAHTDGRSPDAGVRFFFINGAADDPTEYPRTPEGIGVGSTFDEVLAAYPDAVAGDMRDLGAGDLVTLTVKDAETGSKYVFAGYPGELPVVTMMQWGPDAGHVWSHLCIGM